MFNHIRWIAPSRSMMRWLALTSLALVAVVMLVPAGARANPGLTSPSFTVRAHTLSSGGVRHLSQTSPSFVSSGCLGELGTGLHTSTNFQLLAGYCNQARWFLGAGTVIGVIFPELSITTALAPPAPNPARGPVRLPFSIEAGQTGTIRIYDISGRLIRTLIDRLSGPAGQVVTWDLADDGGRPVASGIYFARMQAGSTDVSRRIVLLDR